MIIAGIIVMINIDRHQVTGAIVTEAQSGAGLETGIVVNAAGTCPVICNRVVRAQ